MFDITSQAVVDTAPIHIKGANGDYLYYDGKPVQIVLHSPGSKAFAAVEARQTARTIKRMNDNDGNLTAVPPEQRRAEQAEDLADITVAFENFTYPPAEGKQGKELFQAFYADPKLGYMTQQVLKALANWGNFKPGSPGN